MSVHSIERMFHKHLGVTPRQYADARRVAELKRLLRNGANVTHALPTWRQWLINTFRDLNLRHLLRHRAPFRPFGIELDMTRAVDWILGHGHAHMHM